MRKSIALAPVMVVLGLTGVVAQGDPIAARKALMKGNNDNASAVAKMMSGDEPFDAAKVDAAFAQWAETAQKLPGLFPDDSKTGGQTRATAKIWETRSDFQAKDAAFGKAVADNRDKAKTLDGLKASVTAVFKACDNCHERYRVSSRR
jgi:cytochrome c556